MSGFATNLRSGIASMLDDAGVVTWTESGAVDPSADPPPIFHHLYPDEPDVAVALTTYYPGGDAPAAPDSVVMLQVRTRSSTSDDTLADDLDDAIAAQLLGHYPMTLSTGVVVSVITRSSGSPIGRDARGRLERTTNYRLMAYDPGPHRG
jgi:hypothetical protein